MKDNLFVLGVVAVVLVLGAGFWFLVWSPASNLSAQTQFLTRSKKSIEDYLDSEELPTSRRRELAVDRTALARGQFDDGIEVFERRPSRFKLFFDDSHTPPDPSAFYSRYTDRIHGANGLRASYRKAFNIEADAETDPKQLAPVIDTLDAARFEVGGAEAEVQVRQAMKQVWIAEAIVTACTELGIGGLQAIRFPVQERGRRSRADDSRTAAADAAKPEDLVKSAVREVEVDVRLLQHKIQALLLTLANDDRVPFLEPKAVSYVLPPSELERFSTLVVVHDYPSETQAREQSYETLIQEPLVDCKLTLQVLDWTGVELAAATEEN